MLQELVLSILRTVVEIFFHALLVLHPRLFKTLTFERKIVHIRSFEGGLVNGFGQLNVCCRDLVNLHQVFCCVITRHFLVNLNCSNLLSVLFQLLISLTQRNLGHWITCLIVNFSVILLCSGGKKMSLRVRHKKLFIYSRCIQQKEAFRVIGT